MQIKNFEKLASSTLRRQALRIAEAGFEALNTQRAIEKMLQYNPKSGKLKVNAKSFNLSKFKEIILLAFGKAALDSARAISGILKDKITGGFAIDVSAGEIPNIKTFLGTHPRPSEGNVEAAKEITEYLKKHAKESTLVICAISGGGSALFSLPYEMTALEQGKIFDALTKKGATIQELNTVRKHISQIKGGQLAKLIYPAACLGLVFSDVPGDDLSVIASGCTVKDETTARDAQNILNKYQTLEMAGILSVKLLETPKEDKYFFNIHNYILVSAKTALTAMKEQAELLGLKVKIFNDKFQGEAKTIGKTIVETPLTRQHCLLGAGESTVKIVGHGIGGRNQEMALSVLPKLRPDQVFVTMASDGHDNSDSGGAIVDLTTLKRAQNLGLDPSEYLKNNDSFTFFEKTGDSLDTGPTGANAADLVIFLNG